jgi:hypothetical protein
MPIMMSYANIQISNRELASNETSL